MIPVVYDYKVNILTADNTKALKTFCLGDPTSLEGYDQTGLPRQKLNAFKALALIVSRFSGIAVFASAGRGGKISASVCVCRTNEVSGRLNKYTALLTVPV